MFLFTYQYARVSEDRASLNIDVFISSRSRSHYISEKIIICAYFRFGVRLFHNFSIAMNDRTTSALISILSGGEPLKKVSRRKVCRKVKHLYFSKGNMMKKRRSISPKNPSRAGDHVKQTNTTPPASPPPIPVDHRTLQDFNAASFTYHTPIQSPKNSSHEKSPPPLRVTKRSLDELQMNNSFFDFANADMPSHLMISRSTKSDLFRLWPKIEDKKIEVTTRNRQEELPLPSPRRK